MSENRTSEAFKELVELMENKDGKHRHGSMGCDCFREACFQELAAIAQRYQKMEEALESCDLIVIGQHFPDKLRVIQEALSFDPLQ